jgi:hypothetical protein
MQAMNLAGYIAAAALSLVGAWLTVRTWRRFDSYEIEIAVNLVFVAGFALVCSGVALALSTYALSR